MLSILFSSLIEIIIGHVISSTTAFELWTTFDVMFSSHNQAEELQIRFQLTNLSRGDQSVFEYFSKVKNMDDTLAASGTPLSDKEYVSYLLNGLGPSYESFVISITTHSNSASSTKLFHLLLVHESRMTHSSQHLTNIPFEPLVNLITNQTQCGRGTYHGSQISKGCGRSNSSQGRTSSSQTNFSSHHNSSSRPTCLVCNKHGHRALQCYYRFDHSHQLEPPASFSVNFIASAPPSNPYSDLTWYPDSGATHLLTHDLSQLNLSSEHYGGTKHIRVGNGTTLPISSIDKASLTLNYLPFKLQLIHVPSITKN